MIAFPPFKKILSATIIGFILVVQSYVIFEPSIAEAITATDNVVVTMTVDPGITISDGVNATMAPNLSISANSSIGTSAWTVNTNNNLGYTLAVKASTTPALVSGANSIANYTPAVANTPDVWSVPSGTKEFGFSVFGTDAPTATWGTGANCGSAGTPTATLKYDAVTTTDRTVATRATVTPTAGVATTICFAAAQNGVYANSGTYTATITATATTL